MSRSLHRLLVLVALTLAIAGGWWTLAQATTHEDAPPSDHGTALALIERTAEAGIVGARLRTPTAGSAAPAPRRFDLSSALPSRLAHYTAERTHRLPLYTLLRSLRI